MKEFKEFIYERFRRERTLSHEMGEDVEPLEIQPYDPRTEQLDLWLKELPLANEIYRRSVDPLTIYEND